MSRSKLLGLVAVMVLGVVPALAQTNSPVRYFYDDLGRLTNVVDPAGNSATYRYDAVGNLLSITRTTVPANSGLAILNFSPQQGPAGVTVILQGQGFSATASANAVQFNGTAAIVTAATASTLTVSVPTGATTGPISITVGGVTATSNANFTITPATLVSIVVSPMSTAVASGSTQQFTATGSFNDGTTQDLTTSATWSSSSTSVATISNSTGSQGLATAASNGFTTIKATVGPASGFATLKVRDLPGLSVRPSNISVVKGSLQQFTLLYFFSDGTASIQPGATWSSSNPAVATISNTFGSQGLATSVALGTTTITAQSGSTTSSAVLTVTSLSSIAVTPANNSIPKGSAQQFTATGTNNDGTTKDVTNTVTWSTSDTSIALVGNVTGSYGLARAMGVGTATITASSGAISGSTTLTATAPVPTSITITPATPFVPSGATQQFTAVLGLSDGSTQDVTSATTWSSSNPAVATISNAGGSQGLASGVGIGTTTITGNFTGTTGTFSNSVTLTVANSVVSGRVIFSDGSPVPFPDVFVTRTDSQGNLQTFFTSLTDANGNYWVTNVGLGAFTVIAQDSNSGLNASANGSLVALNIPITVNVQLPPGGSVSGTFRDATGATIPNANVQVFSTGATVPPTSFASYTPIFFNALTTTDFQGVYLVNNVSVGEVVVTASPRNFGGGGVVFASPLPFDVAFAPLPSSMFAAPLPPPYLGQFDCGFSCSSYVGAASGSLGTAGQLLFLDVTLPPISTITGKVYASDGVTPVPNAQIVAVENAGIAGGLADFYTSGYYKNSTLFTADSSGNFQIDGLPVGSVNIVANAPTVATTAAVTGALTVANPLILNPIMGNAFSFKNGEYQLTDPNGFVYDMYCDGSLFGAGPPPVPKGVAAHLWVNREQIDCKDSEYGVLDQAGQQLRIGPRPGGAKHLMLQVQRKIFVPTTGGYARYLDTLTNPLDVPITTNVLIEQGFDATNLPETLAADPASNGNKFAVVQNSTNAASPIFGFVLSGANSGVPPNFFSHLTDPNNPTVTYQYSQANSPEFHGSVTIAPHQTVTFMHFIIQWNHQDLAGAVAKAQALANLTDPNELVGMSAQERSQVVNFNVP